MDRRRKYNYTFELLDTKDKAERFCAYINKNYTPYMRRKYGKVDYSPYKTSDGSFDGYIAFYYR